MKYLIEGGRTLAGEIEVSGNKNAVFPCVAAALLTEEKVVLQNIPDLKDTEVLIEILKTLGVDVSFSKKTLYIQAKNLKSSHLPGDLMSKLRGSIVLAGALLARLGRVSFHHPGGDIIGTRHINTHLEGFKTLGATVKKNDLQYILHLEDAKGQISIFLHEASVTACGNLILASVLGKKEITLKNCPTEPHIQDLCSMLINMGANIKGVDSDTLKITGVEKLKAVEFSIGADYIEVGTYAIAAGITGGKIKILNVKDDDLDPVIKPLERFGIKFERKDGAILVSKENLKSPLKLTTNIWPGFPTDLMSAAIVLATQTKGVTLCHDWMYESRMFFADKLISMGANIILADPHRLLVYGPTKLKGRVLDTPDIRAGMALVLAGLVARGQSIINQAELIERGYEDVSGKLTKLGAVIQKI